jgi:adenine phosphoribosyltransferase
MNHLKELIRDVPDYPKPGILFYDLTTLLKDKQGFHALIDRLCDHFRNHTIDIVVGIEARGFIFAPALAYRLGAGFVPVRKPKKLPGKALPFPTILNTALTLWKSMKTPSRPANG